eukprot:2652200-Pyramimonas_sp.AAC.1
MRPFGIHQDRFVDDAIPRAPSSVIVFLWTRNAWDIAQLDTVLAQEAVYSGQSVLRLICMETCEEPI